MKAAFQRTVDLDIPLDAQWGDIDIMDRFLPPTSLLSQLSKLSNCTNSFRFLDFTYDPESFAGLPGFVRDIQGQGYK